MRETPRLIMVCERLEDNHMSKVHTREHEAINVSAALRTGAEMAMPMLGFQSLLVTKVPCDSEGEDREILETRC